MSEEPIKVPKTQSIKIIIQDFLNNIVKSIKKKFSAFSTKIRDNLTSYYHNYIYVEVKEPSKSFAFDKRFYGLYFLFLFYSFILFLGINDPNNLFFNVIMFGNAFAFANAILLFFLTLSFILNSNKIREYIFEEKTKFKQPLIFGLIIAGYYLLFLIISTTFNYISFYLTLSLIWLILLSTRYYTLSRKISTKIEARFISKYSYSRYFLALIAPVFIITILIIVSLMYRSLLVFIALDFFEPNDPQNAVQVYNFEMRVIMPLIYFSLILTIVFIVLEFIATRRKAQTRKSGCFDNFTFSLIVLFIFLFQILQLTLFILLRSETVAALRNTVGEGSTSVSYLFLIEYCISMFFLYRILLKMGHAFGWRVIFFKTDGLILFFLSCIFAQTLTAFTISNQVENQEVTILGTILLANRYVVSVLMIVFLGLTLLIYYMKPHETSMFMRLQKETIKDDEKNLDILYKLLKNEFIRRGEPYPIEIIERELLKATLVSKNVLYSLIKRLETQKVDIKVVKIKDNTGDYVHSIDFLSITERFEKKEIAEKKARQVLSRKLIEAVSLKNKTGMKVSKKLDDEKASDKLLASLASNYTKKKEIDELTIKEKKDITFAAKQIPESIKQQIIDILKDEYTYRIENDKEYPTPYYPISEIVNEIATATKISVGEIYPILENISKTDIELNLISNPEEPTDKRIKFYPIADDNINRALINFRPNEYYEVKIRVIKDFIPTLKQKNSNAGLANIKRKIPSISDNQKVWRELIECFYQDYPIFMKVYIEHPDKNKYYKLTNALKKMKKPSIAPD